METIALDAIKFDTSVYPRDKWKTSTIERYVDCMQRGDVFPPLCIEEGTQRLLDGVHRWKAYLAYRDAYEEILSQQELIETEYNRRDDWAKPVVDIPVEYHTVPKHIPVKLYAAGLSVKHGDRISDAERKALAREIFEENPDFTLADLEAYLHVSKFKAGQYVSDIRARRREAQRTIAYRLHRLGWTQQEIAEGVGVAQQSVSRDFLQQFPESENDVKKLLTSGIPHLDVAERFHLPLILVHAIDLHGRDDEDRMKRLNISIQPYDVWNFTKCDDLFGTDWPGRIPGQLIAHVLYFFTKPGAMVVDPMAGSGTTVDVCLAFNRGCYAYDMNLEHNRPDILEHNILQDPWPERVKKADLIFWDPPYFDKKADLYQEGNIGELEPGAYLDFFKARFAEAYGLVKKGTRLAFLMSDWNDNEGADDMIGVWDYASRMQDAGWRIIRHIMTPLSTQQVHPDIVNKFRKSRKLARLGRSLLIAEK